MTKTPPPENLTQLDLDLLGQLEFEIAYPDVDPMIGLVMEAIQANLMEYGTECHLKRLDRTAYTTWRREGKFDAFLGNWWADYPDPDNFVTPLFVSNSESNRTRFSNSRVDDLAVRAREEVDPRKRARLYEEITASLLDECPMVFLWHLNEEVLVQPWVVGYRPASLFQGSLFLHLGIQSAGRDRAFPPPPSRRSVE